MEAHEWIITNDEDFQKVCYWSGFDPDLVKEKYLLAVKRGDIKFTEKQINWIKYYRHYEAITIPEEEKNSFRKWVDVDNIYTFENAKQKRTTFYSTTTNKRVDVLEELEDILYKSGCLDEYGSFAGEFNVNGTVKLDVFTYKWQMDGNQSIEQSESISDEGEL